MTLKVQQALMAVTMQHFLEHGDADPQLKAAWLEQLANQEACMIWGGAFQDDGTGFEFSRPNAPSREQLWPQLSMVSEPTGPIPAVLDGKPSENLFVIAAPGQGGKGVTGLVLNLEGVAPASTPAWAYLGVALLGLVLSLAAVNTVLAAPVRQMDRVMASVRDGVHVLTVTEDAPAELRTLAVTLQQTQEELRRYRTEAAELRHSLEHRVEQRTKAANRAAEQAEREAGTDTLTTLLNRRALNEDLPELVKRHRSESLELCVLLIDLDHFKQVNDSLGHAVGDEVLKFLGQLLRGSIRRDVDRAYRYGGDEFVVLLTDVTPSYARHMAERLLALFRQRIKTMANFSTAPDLSIGLATLQEDQPTDHYALLEMADRAMYFAKRTRKRIANLADVATGVVSAEQA